MKKNINDYLHLYLGCEVVCEIADNLTGRLMTVGENCQVYGSTGRWSAKLIKPILRPLSDMTIDEARVFFQFKPKFEIYSKEVTDHVVFNYKWLDEKIKPDTKDGYCYSAVGIPLDGWKMELKPEQFSYLLSKGFDLFNLIPEGLAIDKTIKP